MIEINARNDPKANVDIPETPCPIVHPSERTPPIPINIPPIACLVKSRFVTNHSSLKSVSYTHLTLPTNREV